MTFKDAAFVVLKKAGKPLHVSEITKRALLLLKTGGKTPQATMSAQLAMDIKTKVKSRFAKVAPSVFDINPNYAERPLAPAKPKKSKPIAEDFVSRSVVQWLTANGWGYLKYKGLHDHGVDIRARRVNCHRFYSVETKGGTFNENNFIHSLGQIVTRMKDDRSTRNYYGLGLPENSANIALGRLPWQVAKKLLLNILSVNHNGKVREYRWQDMQRKQVKPPGSAV